MPKNVRAYTPFCPQINHEQHKKLMLKRHEIFEVNKNLNQNEVDDKANEGRKKNTKFPER